MFLLGAFLETAVMILRKKILMESNQAITVGTTIKVARPGGQELTENTDRDGHLNDKDIDFLSLAGFVLAFIIFNLCYWSTVLN